MTEGTLVFDALFFFFTDVLSARSSFAGFCLVPGAGCGGGVVLRE